jgi:hypothetical protein
MSLLTLEKLKSWSALLPPEFAAEVGDPDPESAPHLAAISEALPGLKDSDSVTAFVAANEDAFIGIGRAGRIRFLAWCRGVGHADGGALIERLTEGDGDEGKGTGKVAPYFKSDLEAIAAALGKRMARGMVDAFTLDVIAGASYDVVGALDMRGGGL